MRRTRIPSLRLAFPLAAVLAACVLVGPPRALAAPEPPTIAPPQLAYVLTTGGLRQNVVDKLHLTDAQAAYRAAYDAYQAGNYTDAAASARIANELAEVATGVQRAATSPGTSGAPVTVPAPNFR
jgi:hypothetical protein